MENIFERTELFELSVPSRAVFNIIVRNLLGYLQELCYLCYSCKITATGLFIYNF